MCGIVGVLRRPGQSASPDLSELASRLDRALVAWSPSPAPASLEGLAAQLGTIERALRGAGGTRALVRSPELAARMAHGVATIDTSLRGVEDALDAADLGDDGLEATNAALVYVRDELWRIRRDRLATAQAVATLAGGVSEGALDSYWSIEVALESLERLEVRGRDSAGLLVLVRESDLDPADPEIVARRSPKFESGAVRAWPGFTSFVYKTAAEIGELGDNAATLRRRIGSDELLHRALGGEAAHAVVLGHTRWASIGAITEANAHPVDETELGHADTPFVAVAQNGDVDNHDALRASEHLEIAPEITSDAKVVPALISHRLATGDAALDAYRATVARLEGSLALAACTNAAPNELFCSLRGSGQALYVGLAENAFILASEPYGLVGETDRYFRLDGERPADPENPIATRGQVVVLDDEHAGQLDGITRVGFDGTPLPVDPSEIMTAEISTRDVDRGEHPHYLLKEINEAPSSFRKTLRGRIVERDGLLVPRLGDAAMPASVREGLASGSISRVIAIGQGTAAVAGQTLIATLRELAPPRITTDAQLATELSGFGLRADMSDTLVVAVSQSGTTTDTNRTVDLARTRGATVIGIVNRRNSDLADRADGVLFTSDGRDVEMSVASTKAFYSQVAAGALLAASIAGATAEGVDGARVDRLMRGLRALPDAMNTVLNRREELAVAAAHHALSRRYWAVVGNGTNRIAASEVRIKLSELCYKSIASDGTEDKKHIDLSAEPLIIVCAAGLSGSNADDVAKEVAIYRAHRAVPIVIASEGDDRFGAAAEVVFVPRVDPTLDFVLSTMVGHLFGYEAALAIDASARPLREARRALEELASEVDPDQLLASMAERLAGPAGEFFSILRRSEYDGHLEASTAVRVASLVRFALGAVPLDFYELEQGAAGTPAALVSDLVDALGDAINQLTRPVDAIKHQAKTVTVGISRSDETLLDVPLVREVLGAGAARDRLSYRTLRTLVELDRAVDEVVGFTRYGIDGDVDADRATVSVLDRGGVAAGLTSRTDADPRLRGIKHRVAIEREVTVARGAADDRTLVIIPEVKGNQPVGITLLHVKYHPRLTAESARSVLEGYRNRYGALRDAVLETESTFDDGRLAEVDLIDLLTVPVHVMAERWRQ